MISALKLSLLTLGISFPVEYILFYLYGVILIFHFYTLTHLSPRYNYHTVQRKKGSTLSS